jgi:hypothetical protein
MSRSGVVGAVVTAMLISGCAQRTTRDVGGDVVVDARPAAGAWGADFRGMGGWERLRGSAFAVPFEKGTRVSLTIERAFESSNYGWDVREGTCAAPGRILGEAANYPAIFADEDGRDGKVADLGVGLERGKSYVVSVYSSPTDRKTMIACGALKQ